MFSMLDMEPGRYRLTVFGNKEIEGKMEKIKIKKFVILFKDHPSTVNFVLDCNLDYDKRGDEI
jgi:hypothetical protein